jgi:RNA polymerase sigma-70 factor (ECF subfamily)
MRNDALKTLIRRRDPPYQDASLREVADGVLHREVLRSLFRRLPAAQSEAFVMHFALGLKVRDIAAAAGVPVNTVHSRLRLAKATLRSRAESEPALRDVLNVHP